MTMDSNLTFTADDFAAYGSYASLVANELNDTLKQEITNSRKSGSVHPTAHLHKDMLNNPHLYLSDKILNLLQVPPEKIKNDSRYPNNK
ncbi:MAG: hypothetical protein ACRBCI_12205 [Cellvibrionaceae bacterium]